MSPQPLQDDRVQKDMMAVATLERDAELMLRVRDGDTESFALLLDRHRSPVIHFVYRMVQNQPVAEELAQEVFLRVYRSRANYEPTAKFTTWLFRIASHLALNWIRDRRHERGQESLDEATPDGMARQVSESRCDMGFRPFLMRPDHPPHRLFERQVVQFRQGHSAAQMADFLERIA